MIAGVLNHPNGDLRTTKRLIYTNLLPTKRRWDDAWNFYLIIASQLCPPKVVFSILLKMVRLAWETFCTLSPTHITVRTFVATIAVALEIWRRFRDLPHIKRNISDEQFTEELQYFNPVSQGTLDMAIDGTWLRNFYVDQVHDLVHTFRFTGCSEENIYPVMLEKMRLDTSVARYSALNTDFTARPNTRAAISRMLIGNGQYTPFLRDNSMIFENTISYFHWTLLLKDYINLKRCVTPGVKLGNASPSVRIIHQNGGEQRW